MLLRDDVIADRQAEAGALAGRLCREEWLEQLVFDVIRNAGAIVAHADLDRISDIAGRYFQRGFETEVHATPSTPAGRKEAIAEEVQEYSGYVLRADFDCCNPVSEIAVQCDVKALVLCAGAVIGEIQRLIDQCVEINLPPLSRRAARVF